MLSRPPSLPAHESGDNHVRDSALRTWIDRLARASSRMAAAPHGTRVRGPRIRIHRLGKLHNLDRVIEFFQSLDIPAAEYQAPFVAATEFSCGLLLIAGLATRFAAVPLIVTMLVAIRTALWPDLEGVIDLFGKEEFLFIVLLGWLAVAGAGAVSLDALAARLLHSREIPARGASLHATARREAQRS